MGSHQHILIFEVLPLQLSGGGDDTIDNTPIEFHLRKVYLPENPSDAPGCVFQDPIPAVSRRRVAPDMLSPPRLPDLFRELSGALFELRIAEPQYRRIVGGLLRFWASRGGGITPALVDLKAASLRRRLRLPRRRADGDAAGLDGLEARAVERATRASEAEMERRGYGMIPASWEAVAALRTAEGCGGGGSCAVCLEDMTVGEAVTWLPCQHAFHGMCITRWLERSHVCPVCRHKLPVA